MKMDQLSTLPSSSVNFDCFLREPDNKEEEHIENRVRCIDIITRTVLFLHEFEQKLGLNFNDQERDKEQYLSALILLSEINLVTTSSSFSDMVQMALGLQAKLLCLLIGFTNKELRD
jgi:hypothetical protein